MVCQNRGSNLVTWTRLPTHISDDLESHQWLMRPSTTEIFIPGRSMTAVNTGMGSPFWMMTNGLQMFSTKMQLTPAQSNNQIPVSVCPN